MLDPRGAASLALMPPRYRQPGSFRLVILQALPGIVPITLRRDGFLAVRILAKTLQAMVQE
jgi:hypothetical protein